MLSLSENITPIIKKVNCSIMFLRASINEVTKQGGSCKVLDDFYDKTVTRKDVNK